MGDARLVISDEVDSIASLRGTDRTTLAIKE
jgi:hypothetical protein